MFWFAVMVAVVLMTIPVVWMLNKLEDAWVIARARRNRRRKREAGKRGMPIR